MDFKNIVQSHLMLLMIIFLSGCLFPKNELSQNQVPYEDQLMTVQNAVDQFKEQTNGLIPIKTKDADTPIFEKYLIDFDQLQQQEILSAIPGNAFESGGIYQYVIIDPEETAEVKLIDLRTTEAIRKVNVKLDIYRDKHLYPPFGEEVAEGLYKIDYKKLNFKEEPFVESPFTQNDLPLVMNVHGELFIDYRKDLMQALNEFDHSYTAGDDIRFLLTEHYPFVPAHTIPYTIENNEPIFMLSE